MITNKFNLPAPIYNAITNNTYTRGDADISVTDLIDPPRLVALRNVHADEIDADASDLVYSLLGTVMHGILERGGIHSGKGETETRLSMKVNGWKVSGQFDYIDDSGVLWDWKFVSVYEYINGVKSTREQQLNYYALLASHHHKKINGLRVGFVFRDWSKFGAERDPAYPRVQAMDVSIPLWSITDTKKALTERVKVHQKAHAAVAKGEEPDECTPEERWAKPAKWAVEKVGTKKAIKLLDSEDTANTFATALRNANPKNKYTVKYRPGEQVRCKSYCPVLKWCNQGKALLTNETTG